MLRRSLCLVGSVTWIACTQACAPSALVPSDGPSESGGAANVGGTPGGGTGAQSGQSGGASSGGASSDGTGGQVSGTGGESASGGSGGSIPVGDSPTALQAAAAMGRGVNLGQMFESTQHVGTLALASAKIDAYYARGFRNLRIPITWTEAVSGDLLVTDATTGEVNREHPRLAVIESIVDYALSKPDLYVIINAHHEVALKTESRSAVLERLWQDIADIFSERNHRLLFEILNEPHRSDAENSAMPAADLRLMTGLAYDKIRAVDAERIVLFGGNQWFAAKIAKRRLKM